jgi:hypothetical protein
VYRLGMTRSRNLALIVLVACTLAGCKTVYANSDPAKNNEQKLQGDWARCQAQAGQACGYGTYSGVCTQSIVKACMAGEGWTEE